MVLFLKTISVITCQRPQLSRELHIASNPFKQTFYYNESVKFQCSAGFSLQGPSVKYCQNKGDFQKDLPTCSSKHWLLFFNEEKINQSSIDK